MAIPTTSAATIGALPDQYSIYHEYHPRMVELGYGFRRTSPNEGMFVKTQPMNTYIPLEDGGKPQEFQNTTQFSVRAVDPLVSAANPYGSGRWVASRSGGLFGAAAWSTPPLETPIAAVVFAELMEWGATEVDKPRTARAAQQMNLFQPEDWHGKYA